MLLTVSEVAKQMKVNKNYVYKLINCGLLTCIIVGSKKVREETLENFLKEHDGQDVDIIIAEREKEKECES